MERHRRGFLTDEGKVLGAFCCGLALGGLFVSAVCLFAINNDFEALCDVVQLTR